MTSPSTSLPSPLVEATLPLPLYTRGKVRDVYAVEDMLLIIATDRLSAFDHVLPTPIPDKGRVLTQLSAFWFAILGDLLPHHLVSTRVEDIAQRLPGPVQPYLSALAGRVMLVRKAVRFDVECVVRGYLTGSAWEEYQRTGTVATLALRRGLRNGNALPEPIFTPATKAAHGHDENISFAQMAALLGAASAGALREASLALYDRAARHAQARGLILADTKFEFGLLDGRVTLIDEALTPDSSRYWDAGAYPHSLVAYDKQFVRDYLTQCGWDRSSPPPPLPSAVVEATRGRYLETYRRLTGTLLQTSAPNFSEEA